MNEKKEDLYKQLQKNVRSANAKLQRLRGHFGNEFGWAGQRLIDKLNIPAINGITEKGYIRYNKNLSTTQTRAIIKATNEFAKSKTSTVKGVRENIAKIQSGIGKEFNVDSKTAQSILDFFTSDDYKNNKEVKYEQILIAIEVSQKGGSFEDFAEKVKNYHDYGNDVTMIKELQPVYDLVQAKGANALSKLNMENIEY